MPPVLRIADAVRARTDVAVIAEVKRRSPSRGVINAALGAAAQARAYAAGGAAALSILTEPSEFGGSGADLEAAGSATGLPLLRKDFHVEPVQLLEARAIGASAILLIARALPSDRLWRMAEAASAVGLEVLVEVRTDAELEEALGIGDAIIGVNSRNLETLEVQPTVMERLVRCVPSDRVAVAESGIASRDDVLRAAEAGADAVLVGSMLSASADPTAAVAALTGVARTSRAR